MSKNERIWRAVGLCAPLFFAAGSASAQRVTQPRPPVSRASALASAAMPALPGANSPLAPQARVSVAGFVYDSLSESPLAGADVQLLSEGPDARVYDARTDSAGHFVLPAVDAGRYLAGFFHPRVDSLGLDLPPSRISVAAGTPTELRLATPSRQTLIAAFCPPDSSPELGGLLLGAVRDAESGDRLSFAMVSVQWSELALQDSSLATVRRSGMIPATGDGQFAVCRLPVDAELTVRAAVASDTSGAVALQFPPNGVLAHDIFVAPTRSNSARATANLTGRVLSADGAPVANARLTLWGYDGEVRTAEDGRFAFADVPGGSTTLDVRGVGFEPIRRAIDLRSGPSSRNSLDLVVARAATKLAPVTIIDTRISSVLTRSGFDKRRTAPFGRFVDARELEKMHVISTTQALGRFPGMFLKTASRGTRLFMRDPQGLACAPTVWVDGAPYSPKSAAEVDGVIDIDLFAIPDDIAGIEIYRRASQAPLQFAGTTRSACGVIVIWRKGGQQ